MHTQVYLFFDGRCDEALDFYKKNLGIEVEMLMRFKDAPDKKEAMCMPGNDNKVMHSELRIGAATIMASDGCKPGEKMRFGLYESYGMNEGFSSAQAWRVCWSELFLPFSCRRRSSPPLS